MKKKLALVLTAALAAASLTACGGSGTADTKAAGSQAEGASGEKAASGDGSEMVVAWWGNQVRNERTQAILELYSQRTVFRVGRLLEQAGYGRCRSFHAGYRSDGLQVYPAVCKQ